MNQRRVPMPRVPTHPPSAADRRRTRAHARAGLGESTRTRSVANFFSDILSHARSVARALGARARASIVANAPIASEEKGVRAAEDANPFCCNLTPALLLSANCNHDTSMLLRFPVLTRTVEASSDDNHKVGADEYAAKFFQRGSLGVIWTCETE